MKYVEVKKRPITRPTLDQSLIDDSLLRRGEAAREEAPTVRCPAVCEELAKHMCCPVYR